MAIAVARRKQAFPKATAGCATNAQAFRKARKAKRIIVGALPNTKD